MFEMRDQIVDQTFRFDEQEDRHVEQKVPPVWMNNCDIQNKCFNPDFVVSYKKAYLEKKDDSRGNNEAIICMHTKFSPMPTNFNLQVYENAFRQKLVHNYIVNVNSLKGQDVNGEIGKKVTFIKNL